MPEANESNRQISMYDAASAAVSLVALAPGKIGGPAPGAIYSSPMNDTSDNNKTGKTGFAAEIGLLERRVEELLLTVDALKEENRALRQRQDVMMTERATLLQKNEQVRARVEAMIGRLKAMEHSA
jgi:cell division protein ZapB